MDETSEVGAAKLEKHWSELAHGAKIERMRRVIKRMQEDYNDVMKLLEPLRRHEHSASGGPPVVPIGETGPWSNQYHGLAQNVRYYGRPEEGDDVYF